MNAFMSCTRPKVKAPNGRRIRAEGVKVFGHLSEGVLELARSALAFAVPESGVFAKKMQKPPI